VYVLRCARALYERIEPWAAPEREPPTPSTTRLGDWAARLVVVRRSHLVLAVSHVTLLPVLLTLAPATTFLSRFPNAVGQTLRALGIGRSEVASEIAAMAECTVTGPGSRRVLGSLNDFARLLETHLGEGPLVDVGIRLAEMPCRPLDMARPRDEAVRVLSVARARLFEA
jgi:hypothetical protein